MNRNTNAHFSIAPQVNIERSTFNRDSTVKTSFNVGEVIPFYLEEVLPGDTFKIKTSKIARMQTLKTPMMDDVFLDTYYFFVPNRLVWQHWREFMGENTSSAWIPETTYSIPQITSPSGGWNVGTIADYLGIPTGVSNLSVNALPFRSYALVCDSWFRDENLMDPLLIPVTDSTVAGSNGSTYTSDVAKGGAPFIACKTHDYFTSALPAPLKGPDVEIPLIEGDYLLPVHTWPAPNKFYLEDNTVSDESFGDYAQMVKQGWPMLMADYTQSSTDGIRGSVLAHNTTTAGGTHFGFWQMLQDVYKVGTAGDTNEYYIPKKIKKYGSDTDYQYFIPTLSTIQSDMTANGNSALRPMLPVNLVADAQKAVMSSINTLRQAFQVQRFYEKCARGGSRYIEIIKAHFGVTSPDARMMRPEYLGGNRLPLNVRQITQTSSTTSNQPLGDVAGMSVTTDNHFDFEKSFTEHGYIIGCCVARYQHTYQQGIDRLFNRKSMFDFYWPTFAHLGEQAIKNKEIYAQGSDVDDEVFGYQEAWAEYRYKPNRVTGMMRSASNSGLDSWHLADDYDSKPSLSASWIREDKASLDRVLQVTSSVANQIFTDIYVENKTTRPMPLYSIPGLIDHF